MTCFCTFWQSAFSVTCFGAVFLGGECVGVNVRGAGKVLGWNVFEDDARNIGFNLYPIQHQLQKGLRLHVQGGKDLLVRVSYVPGI